MEGTTKSAMVNSSICRREACHSARALRDTRRHFPAMLDVRVYPDGDSWELLKPFIYIASDGSRTEVPAETLVNGASVPRFWWRVIGSPKSGRYVWASVPHDYLWEQAKLGQITFRQANWVFWDAMVTLGETRWRAWAMWAAVTLNGWWQQLRPRKRSR